MARSKTQQDEAQAPDATTRNDELDISRNGDSHSHTEVDAAATEGTPLLATDLPADAQPKPAMKVKVILMCATFLLIIEVGAFMMEPPTQQIMEDIICRDRFPDHPIGKDGVGDGRCKMVEIQKTLAALKSMNMFAQMLCPLLVQVPYGLVADKYGRRPVLFMAILGVALINMWCLLVLLLSDILPLWSMVPGAILLLIGGGGPMAGAMVFTIVADVTPIAERAPVFYQVTALMLILSAALGPLAGWLMSIDPWLPAWLGEAIMLLGVFFTLFVPETKDFRADADAKATSMEGSPNESLLSHPAEHPGTPTPAAPDHGFVVEAWRTVQSDTMRIWRFILSSPRIMILILCEGLVLPITLAMLMFALQYITARFSWDWSKATYVVSISRITSCIMLLVVLPLLSRVLTKNFGVNPVKRDLGLARLSAVFITCGSLLLAVADVPWVLMLALAVFGLSSGYGAQCRALITALVEPHMLATVNTTMSMTGTVLAMIGTPAIGWLLGEGFDMGGAWQGLPYFVFTLIGLFMVAALCLFQIPADLDYVEERI